MEHLFLTPELTETLHKVGFLFPKDEEALGYFDEDDLSNKLIIFQEEDSILSDPLNDTYQEAILYDQAFNWLKREHEIDIFFRPTDRVIPWDNYKFKIHVRGEFRFKSMFDYQNLRAAKEEAIRKSLEIALFMTPKVKGNA